jgi:hypothetical protein
MAETREGGSERSDSCSSTEHFREFSPIICALHSRTLEPAMMDFLFWKLNVLNAGSGCHGAECEEGAPMQPERVHCTSILPR